MSDFNLVFGVSPTESRFGVPQGMELYRCGADDKRILEFPEDKKVINLAKKILDCEIQIVRKFDTCIVFAIPVEIDENDLKDFNEELFQLLLKTEKNLVFVTTGDFYAKVNKSAS